MGLTVAVTGPTGEIGISAVTALEREPAVERILGMARRPFDPLRQGWAKTVYRRGDILDRGTVEGLVAHADVVIHLAFTHADSPEDSERANLQGTRNVFEAAVAAAASSERARRLVYVSSADAYGYRAGNPALLTEDVPARGSGGHHYSTQKSLSEAVLAEVTAGSGLQVFVLRPCIVAGPAAPALAAAMPWNQLPAPLRAVSRLVPALKPVVCDSGLPLQLVHHDDVASAIALAAVSPAPPGAYNIAGNGVVTVSDVAVALGGRPVRMPAAAATAASAIAHLPYVPSLLHWLHVTRTSVVVDTTRAKRHLGWRPTYTSAETLAALAAGGVPPRPVI
ncbi:MULTISPECIES: NAD-dependent epimerase/dehydratase family protein [Mycobacterium]|uniref:NAD-dependent epimerase/dehydratase family protein n=1 Tax=Mycobacterium TaxID=1763 RepID=UPI001EF04D97|nr:MULTISPECIES: NAD-dependent epimerase/dehydratase family protein [Mycobacterium]BDB43563.1 hypothetical protein IWGMT90018_40090 [Mycobacterium kiyosense]BDE13279.1 hypothetical protein MKCMC460_21390 [Mycobacterium sp. 20KCMC460]GLB91959.1 hypothetical protein SRL2020130_47760 [Mycobacterium kiyosense]GLC03266.1 hypothetical protein SRL2020400_38570 [Mycobacterium kiyosense]GLC08199.1 hypothetical protein SRL2020411_28450 [Mycobacterium kiyosense]